MLWFICLFSLQEVIIGLCCGLVVMTWIAAGSVVYGVKHNTLPVRTDGCEYAAHNRTINDTIIGLCCGLVVMTWIAAGSVVYGVKHNTLPVRTDGCEYAAHNRTINDTVSISEISTSQEFTSEDLSYIISATAPTTVER